MKKDCIVYLLRAAQRDVDLFISSVKSLERHFFSKNDVDVLCFHERDLLPYISQILNSVETKIKFIKIEFSIPESNNHLDIPSFYPHPTHGNGPIAWGHPGFSLGYRHMCRFFSGEIFKRQELNEYRFYMRMDNDSFILKDVTYNVFDYMESNKKHYGFIAPAVQYDHPKVSEGLWDESLEWYNKNKNICVLEPLKDIELYKMYYTNFEICSLEWFKTGNYMKYYDFIDSLGGFFTKRWGDAIVRYLGVNLLMHEDNKYPIYDIAYRHGDSYNT